MECLAQYVAHGKVYVNKMLAIVIIMIKSDRAFKNLSSFFFFSYYGDAVLALVF